MEEEPIYAEIYNSQLLPESQTSEVSSGNPHNNGRGKKTSDVFREVKL
jgi:hypothetical protein